VARLNTRSTYRRLRRTNVSDIAGADWCARDRIEHLRDTLARADVVVGMASLLSQPV